MLAETGLLQQQGLPGRRDVLWNRGLRDAHRPGVPVWNRAAHGARLLPEFAGWHPHPVRYLYHGQGAVQQREDQGQMVAPATDRASTIIQLSG